MSITMTEFLKKYREETLNIIDIRPHASFLKGTIKGARNIPFTLLSKFPEKYLDEKNIYYIFCDEGYYSNKLIEELKDTNYKIVQIEGGYQAL